MTTVADLFRSAAVRHEGHVRWGERVPLTEPGVYVVSSSADPTETAGAPQCQVDSRAVQMLLEVRPEATIDGAPANAEAVARRLGQLWIPGAPVLYIGLAGTSVQQRVGQYYKTEIGARAPHAGGWPLKMLANLSDLWVHFGPTEDPDGAEIAMIDEFVAGTREADLSGHVDPSAPLPYANLQFPGGRRKNHGFAGVKEQRTSQPVRQQRREPAPTGVIRPVSRGAIRPGSRRTQNITAADLAKGQIRVPKPTKEILPPDRADIDVVLRGAQLSGRWDPRFGPDKERSGIIRLPKADLNRLVQPGGPLGIVKSGDVYEID